MGNKQREIKRGKMEEKYDSETIHLYAGMYIIPIIFSDLFEQAIVISEVFYEKFAVSIEIKGTDKEGYIIMPGPKGTAMLLKGSFEEGTTRIITDQKALYNDRDLLGKVTAYYDRKIVKEFPSYDEFWETIKR